MFLSLSFKLPPTTVWIYCIQRVTSTIRIRADPIVLLRQWIHSTKPSQSRIHQSCRIIIKIESSFRIQFLTVVLVRLLAGCGAFSKRHPERIIMITLNNTATGTGYHTIITQMIRLVKIVCAVFNFPLLAAYIYMHSRQKNLKRLRQI